MVLVAAGVVAAMQRGEWVESYIAAYLTAAVCVLTFVGLLLWLVFRAPLSRAARRRGAIAAIVVALLAGGAVKALTRVDGVESGVGVPRLVWRWSPRPAPLPASFPLAATTQPVDLAATTARDFPQFLGPNRDNTLSGVGLSRDWSKPPRLLWRHAVGLGWSSFAAVGDYAVTQEQRGEEELTVCYELKTGKPRWEHANRAHFSEWQGGDGPRATPTISQGRVYVMGATGILDCLDGATGRPLWTRNVLSDAGGGNQSYGKSCSPLLIDDRVVVTGSGSGPSLMAYRASDGAPAWRGGSEPPGYASPVAATLAGVRQILTVNNASVTAHDPADGRVLWRFAWPGSLPKNVNPIALPGDRVLISAAYGLGATMLQVRSNGGTLSVDPLWTSRHLKPKFANNAVRGNYVYGLDDGVLTCLDLATGRRTWRDGRYGFGEILLVDDLLLVQTEPGDVTLVEANPTGLHELGSFPALKSKTWACPALAGHYLLVRNDREAACYELP